MRDNRDQETQRQKRKKVFQKEKNQGEENRGDVQRDCVEHKGFDWLLVSSIKKRVYSRSYHVHIYLLISSYYEKYVFSKTFLKFNLPYKCYVILTFFATLSESHLILLSNANITNDFSRFRHSSLFPLNRHSIRCVTLHTSNAYWASDQPWCARRVLEFPVNASRMHRIRTIVATSFALL